MTSINQIQLDTTIMKFSPAKIHTRFKSTSYIEDTQLMTLTMTSDELAELDTDTLCMQFEKAGPRANLYFDPTKTRCGIVTCGGLCPGINDVIRSIVLCAHYQYSIPTILGFRNGLRGFIPKYQFDFIKLTPDIVSGIHHIGGTILGTSRDRQSIEQIVDALERLNINILFVIGGDGTMRAAKEIVDEITTRKCKISIIGIPKAIDNDINFIPRSFGFDTAVEQSTEVVRCAHVEATSVNNGVGIVKIMGRNAGFIAAHATIASQEVNFLLVPEKPFRLDGQNGLLMALERRLKSCNHALIVVAEGAGQEHVEAGKIDAYGNSGLGDICGTIIQRIKDHFKKRKIEVYMKYIDPSYIIRSVPANAGDRIYCSFLGQHAVHAAMAGKTSMVVAQLKSSMVHLPLDLMVNIRRTLNTNSDYWSSVMETTGQKAFFHQ